MDNLKEALMESARKKGICLDGYKEMRTDDADGLVDYYIENPDWCLERDFPTLPFLRDHFPDVGNKGVFVGKTFHGELLNDLQAYIFHDCRGTIKVALNVDKALIPMLYVANGCRLKIVGTGDIIPDKPSRRSVVSIYSFGKNDISAKDNRYVVFNRYENKLI